MGLSDRIRPEHSCEHAKGGQIPVQAESERALETTRFVDELGPSTCCRQNLRSAQLRS